MIKLIQRIFKSLRFKIIIFYSLLILISISLMGLVSYHIYVSNTDTVMRQNLETIAKLNSEILDIYIKEVINSINVIAVDRDITNLLRDTDSADYHRNLKILKEKISNHTVSNSNIKNITFYSGHYNFTLHTNSEEIIDYSSHAMQKVIQTTNSAKYISIHFLPIKKSDYMYTKSNDQDLLIYFPIKDIYDNDRTLGTVLIQYNFKKLVEICSKAKITNGSYVFLLDTMMQPIVTVNNSDSLKATSLEELRKSKNVLFMEKNIASVSWKLLYVIDLNKIRDGTKIIRKLTVGLISVSVLISILISVYIGYSLTKALNLMRNYMLQFGSGKLDLRIHDHFDTEELQVLSKGFNEMADQMQTLVNVAYNLEIKQKDAQINALEARINPHFLYNSLQLISSLATLGRTNEIHDTIDSMASLYEYILYESKQTVTVEQELTHVHDYLKLQNLRLNNTLILRYYIDSNILSSKIMKLSLQPIVENCINHAFFSSKKRSKFIHITGIQREDRIVFEIVDNGVGIDESDLEALLSRLKTGDASEKSIGLVNVHQRMQLRYGTDYGINIKTHMNSYTKVIITFPLEASYEL